MEISISAKDFTLTPTIRDHVNDRIEKLMRHRSDLIGAAVVLTVEQHHKKGEIFLADAIVKIPGNDVFAVVRARDMRRAIDLVAEKLERQLIKGKEKKNPRRRKPLSL
ncbi:MAG: ribosome-associated translation inhibitor RaiA [bacterium]